VGQKGEDNSLEGKEIYIEKEMKKKSRRKTGRHGGVGRP